MTPEEFAVERAMQMVGKNYRASRPPVLDWDAIPDAVYWRVDGHLTDLDVDALDAKDHGLILEALNGG